MLTKTRQPPLFAPPPDRETVHEQYTRIKQQYPAHLVLIQLGDFYEAFDADAETIAKLLALITVSKRIAGVMVTMAGFPIGAAEPMIAKLIEAGHTVAVAEQVR